MKTINKILKVQLAVLITLIIALGVHVWLNPVSLRDWVNGFNSKTPCEILQEENRGKQFDLDMLQTKRLINYQERMKND